MDIKHWNFYFWTFVHRPSSCLQQAPHSQAVLWGPRLSLRPLLKKDITVLVVIASKLVFMDFCPQASSHLQQAPYAQAVLWGSRPSLRPATQERHNCPCNYGFETCIYELTFGAMAPPGGYLVNFTHS